MPHIKCASDLSFCEFHYTKNFKCLSTEYVLHIRHILKTDCNSILFCDIANFAQTFYIIIPCNIPHLEPEWRETTRMYCYNIGKLRCCFDAFSHLVDCFDPYRMVQACKIKV